MNPRNTTTARTRDAAPAPVKASNALPAYLQNAVKADAGKGVSNSADDSLVPIIVVLQGQSPQTMKPKPEYIKDAVPGAIWLRNSALPIRESILVQPCYFYKSIGEWIPRNPDGSGGGFVAMHDWSEDWTKKLNLKEVEDRDGNKRWMDQNEEHEFVEARNHVVIVHNDDGSAAQYLIPLSGSGHSVSRQWMFMIRNKTVDGAQIPSWAVMYRLKTIMRTKGKNNWYVLDPHEGSEEGTLWATEAQYAEGKKLHEAFAAGLKKADMTSDAAPVPTGADDKTAAAAKAGI